ncbi:MAG: uroporphyrinogen-III synthase [Candidatus Manganitrophus sp.]|nr:MAG: uroporphyrinogen-III synthase [Candidatus Manganitrophus sp.]
MYQSVRPTPDPAMLETILRAKGVDLITFASSSTLRNFMEILGPQRQSWLTGIAIACIGPITAETAREFGLKVDVIPGEYTLPALAESIVDYFRKKE